MDTGKLIENRFGKDSPFYSMKESHDSWEVVQISILRSLEEVNSSPHEYFTGLNPSMEKLTARCGRTSKRKK